MQVLRTVSLPNLDSAQPISDSKTLTLASGPPVPAAMGLTLMRLMAETQARYPKQTLPEGTPDMYLAEWEEMALKYGLAEFRDGLSKAIRDRSRAPFFPEPEEIEAHCAAARRVKRERSEAASAMKALNSLKAQWLRERDEDIANGIPRGMEPAAELDRIVSGRHTPEEIEAWKREQGVTQEALAAARERVETLAEVAAPGVVKS